MHWGRSFNGSTLENTLFSIILLIDTMFVPKISLFLNYQDHWEGIFRSTSKINQLIQFWSCISPSAPLRGTKRPTTTNTTLKSKLKELHSLLFLRCHRHWTSQCDPLESDNHSGLWFISQSHHLSHHLSHTLAIYILAFIQFESVVSTSDKLRWLKFEPSWKSNRNEASEKKPMYYINAHLWTLIINVLLWRVTREKWKEILGN